MVCGVLRGEGLLYTRLDPEPPCNPSVPQEAMDETWRAKLGLPSTPTGKASASKLHAELEDLMLKLKADYTLTFRQLSAVAELPADAEDEDLLQPLAEVFYQPPVASARAELAAWLRSWRAALEAEGRLADAAEAMRRVNPKYLPREWMLVEVKATLQAALLRAGEEVEGWKM